MIHNKTTTVQMWRNATHTHTVKPGGAGEQGHTMPRSHRKEKVNASYVKQFWVHFVNVTANPLHVETWLLSVRHYVCCMMLKIHISNIKGWQKITSIRWLHNQTHAVEYTHCWSTHDQHQGSPNTLLHRERRRDRGLTRGQERPDGQYSLKTWVK